MKKLKMMLLAGVLTISLAACGGKEAKEPDDATTQEAENDSGNAEKEGQQEKDEDEMSQSEWVEAYGNDKMDNGYEIVDEINIDTSEICLKYTGYEIVDDVDDNEQPIKKLVVRFDFTNKSSIPMCSASAIGSMAFQNGIELQGWGGTDILNDMTNIKDGATINIGCMFDLIDTENPVELNISNGINFEGIELFAQQQELNLQ